jgi:hypothetical protein
MPPLVSESDGDDDDETDPIAFKVEYKDTEINIRRNGPLALLRDAQNPLDEAEVEKEMTEALHSYLYQDPTIDSCPDNSQFSYSKAQDGDVRNTVDRNTAQWEGLTLPDLEFKDIIFEGLPIADKEREEPIRDYVKNHQK